MKSLIVLSDTHGNRAEVEKLYPLFAECDMIVHLGDTSSDGARIRSAFPGKTYLLNGNCDIPRLGDDELTLDVEGVKIYACHGDRLGVKRGAGELAAKAASIGADIALYGHTHKACEKVINGVTLFNPGTLSRYAASKSYLYLAVYGGKFTGKIVDIQQ